MKRIRIFRGLTQRELGLELGYEERNAFHLLQLVRNPSKCNASDDKIRLSAIMTTMHGPLPAAMLMRKGIVNALLGCHDLALSCCHELARRSVTDCFL